MSTNAIITARAKSAPPHSSGDHDHDYPHRAASIGRARGNQSGNRHDASGGGGTRVRAGHDELREPRQSHGIATNRLESMPLSLPPSVSSTSSTSSSSSSSSSNSSTLSSTGNEAAAAKRSAVNVITASGDVVVSLSFSLPIATITIDDYPTYDLAKPDLGRFQHQHHHHHYHNGGIRSQSSIPVVGQSRTRKQRRLRRHVSPLSSLTSLVSVLIECFFSTRSPDPPLHACFICCSEQDRHDRMIL
jgi:hypothetical protein